MSFIQRFLGLGGDAPSAPEDPRAMRAIRARLDALPEDEARYLAAFAYVLARTAHADQDVSADEVVAMQRIVQEQTDLGREQVALVVDLATSQAQTLGGTQDFVVTKVLKTLTTPDQRLQILDCLLAVAAADDLIVGEEEREMRLVAKELGIQDKNFLSALSRYRDQRSVMKDWPGA